MQINFDNEIKDILELGKLNGADNSMGHLMSEIWELEQKLVLMSVIKASNGIKETIEEYNIQNEYFTISTVEHFGHVLVCGELIVNNTWNETKAKRIEAIINGWLSNIQIDKTEILIDRKADNLNGIKIKLDSKAIEDTLCRLIVEPELYSMYECQFLNQTLNSKTSENQINKI